MKKIVLTAVLGMLVVTSCKKEAALNIDKVNNTHDLVVPAGFTWENSRDVYFDINVTDSKFANYLQVVAIYDKDPTLGGKLLSKGAASQDVHFTTKVYLANTIKEVFVVRTAPDNSITTQQVSVTSAKVNVSMKAPEEGARAGNKVTGMEDSPGCSTGCTTTVTHNVSNMAVNNGDVVCVTGSNITVSFTVYDGTVRICGNNVTVSNITLNGSSSLIVTGSASATINSLSLYTKNTSFTNYGTSTMSSTLSSNGSILNENMLTVNGDVNVYAGSGFKNNGSVNISGSMNNSTRNTVINNGSIIIGNDLQVYSGNIFQNTCSLWIKGDYYNSGTTKNYNLVKVNGTTQIYNRSEHELYNGAMLKTADIVVSGTLKGNGTPSIIKVSGNSALYKSADIQDALQYCDANGIETNQGSFSGGAELACDVYIPVTNCNSEGNGAPPVSDSDNDGIVDLQDAYPNDAERAFNNFYPTDSELSTATIAFEDQWPLKGDYDFNDVVVSYRYKIVTNAENKVVQLTGDYNLYASGTGYNDGFGIEFPTRRSNVADLQGGVLEENQTNAVVIVFNDVRNEVQEWNTWPSEPVADVKTYSITFTLKDKPALSSFGLNPYNPFIWNGNYGNGRPYEIHLTGKTPTDLADQSLFETGDDDSDAGSASYYVTKTGLPWAINIPASPFSYPIEETDIVSAYLKFQEWAESGGNAYEDWYAPLNGYRDESKIYSRQ